MLRVAAGTAIGGVLVWDTQLSDDPAPVKFQVTGHDGVIFRTVWIDRCSLFTGSDDRTARLWKLNDQTGKYSEEAVLYGHKARVWDVVPLDGGKRCVTASEDATCKVSPSSDIIVA